MSSLVPYASTAAEEQRSRLAKRIPGATHLLRDVPLTPTARAPTELNMSELTREVFIPSVSGFGAGALEADSAIGGTLGTFSPGRARE